MYCEMECINKIYFVTIIKVFITGVVILAILGIITIFININKNNGIEETTTYEFPLQRDVIEQVIDEEQLTWRIEDEQSFIEDQSVFSCRNNDDVFCSLNTYCGDKGRFIILQFYFPQDYTSEQIQQFNQKDWLNILEVTCKFYCSSIDTNKAYKEFLSYLERRDSVKHEYGYFTKRINDTHLTVNLSSFRNDISHYQLSALRIINNKAYENMAASRVDGWKSYSVSRGIRIIDDINVLDIREIETEEQLVRLIVKGYLKDIKKLKKMPKNLQEALTYHPHKDDYFTAKLTDDTGSIDVFLIKTSLNSSELGQNRNHYIDYYLKDKLIIINFSTLNE